MAGFLMLAGGVLAPRLLYRGVLNTGSAMEPGYAQGARMLFRKDPDEVRRGDVVLVTVKAWDDGEPLEGLLVKRVVAVGGDTIAYERGAPRLTLGGKPLDEPYVKDGAPTAGTSDAFSVSVPRGHVFLLGDNRNASLDSRHHAEASAAGTIPVHDVLGVALTREETTRTLFVGGSVIIVGALAVLASVPLGVAWLVVRRRRPAAPQTPVWGAVTVEPAGPANS
ncbi:signal peptidase I [Streptomyces sp. NPDC000075]